MIEIDFGNVKRALHHGLLRLVIDSMGSSASMDTAEMSSPACFLEALKICWASLPSRHYLPEVRVTLAILLSVVVFVIVLKLNHCHWIDFSVEGKVGLI